MLVSLLAQLSIKIQPLLSINVLIGCRQIDNLFIINPPPTISFTFFFKILKLNRDSNFSGKWETRQLVLIKIITMNLNTFFPKLRYNFL